MGSRRSDTAVAGVFFSLLGSVVFERDLNDRELQSVSTLGSDGWEQIAELARIHTVRGLVCSAIENLPEDIVIPDNVALGILAETVGIEKRSAAVSAAAAAETARLEALGLHPLVFKGPAIASLYPTPGRRETGDVDIWLPEYPEDAFPFADIAPDGSLQYSNGGVSFDIHRAYYDLRGDNARLPAPGSPEGTVLMLSAHILKHFCCTGIGMKQLCDLARASFVLDCDDAVLEAAFRTCGLCRWQEEVKNLTVAWRGNGNSSLSALYHIVLKDGNFGSARYSRAAYLKGGILRRKADTAFSIIRRMPFSIKYAPTQAFAYYGELLKGNIRSGIQRLR